MKTKDLINEIRITPEQLIESYKKPVEIISAKENCKIIFNISDDECENLVFKYVEEGK